jgi:glucokinase
MNTEQNVAVAVDIGGSAIKAGLISSGGSVLALTRTSTPPDGTPDDIADQIAALIPALCSEARCAVTDLRGLGVSIAGFITDDGVVTATAHLSRAWIGYDLKARLARTLDLPMYFALDSPAPTLGEAYFGAGKGLSNFVYVTVSTGIGAGIFAEGRYYIGGLGWAGGIGHMIIDEDSDRICLGCGNRGCLETFAALQGVVTTAHEVMSAFPDSVLHHISGANGSAIAPHLVFEAAQQGDEAAQEVWRRVGQKLGIGLTNLVNAVSPTRIVVGGGIAQAGDLLLEPARHVIRERAFPPQHRRVEVVPAALRDLSGVYGGAAMVFFDLHVNPAERGEP